MPIVAGLVEQLHEQAGSLIPPADILTVRRSPWPARACAVLPNGREIEETVTEESDISALAERMLATVSRDGADLLAANLLLRARGLAADARGRIASALDRQAEEIIQRGHVASRRRRGPQPAAGHRYRRRTGRDDGHGRLARPRLSASDRSGNGQPADRRVGQEPGGDSRLERRGAGGQHGRGLDRSKPCPASARWPAA